MAIAKKCDRCGKLYELYNLKNKKGMNTLKTVKKDERGNHFLIETYDLCKECCEEFNKWLEDKNMTVERKTIVNDTFLKSFEEDR